MNKGNWVPLDKNLVKTLKNINRPFSIVEAMFSFSVDRDCGKENTLRGYAKLWSWSVGKTKKFVECLMNTSGTVVERKGNGSGTFVRFVDGGYKALGERLVNSSGTVDEQLSYATIDPNPNPDPKKEKNSRSRSFVKPSLEEVKNYCEERKCGVDPGKWFDYYTANGWRVGKNPMKDWKAAIRTWEHKGDNKNATNNGRNKGFAEARKSGETDWLK